MIYFVNGRPGGGKSLAMAEIIYRSMRRGKNVIANFDVNMDYFAKCRRPERLGRFVHAPNADLTQQAYKNVDPKAKRFSYIDGLFGFALQFHERNARGQIVEGQTLLVLDECAGLFNSRTFAARDRLAWLDFFAQHRKLGYTVYMVAQDDMQIDKQIREMFHKQMECRCVTSMKALGRILSLLCGGSLFVRIVRDYTLMKPMNKRMSKEYAQFYTGRRFYGFYDSYKLFGQPGGG